MIAATGTACGTRDRSRLDPALCGRGFDRRQKAKGEAANDAPAGEGDGDDMFKHAGVAAE
jgi:hypothetical protein